MRSQTTYSLYFWIVSIAFAVFKIIFSLQSEIDLFTEEAQYWLWSRNLDWHYYSKPPLIAVFNGLSTAIFGVNEIGVRINAILLGIGTAWVVFKFAEYRYQSQQIAFWASILMMSMPFWMIFSTFHITDSELTFFWILSLYLVYRGITERSAKWWMWAGIASAFGLLSKSIMIVIGPFVLVYLLCTHRLAIHWKNYLMFLLIGGIGFLPGLIWNWKNDFSTFKHLAFLGGVSGETQSFSFSSWIERLAEYLGGQFAILSVFLLPILLYSIFSFLKKPDKEDAYLLLPAILSWLGFLCITIFTRVEVNWPAFAYSTIPIFISRWIFDQSEKWLKARNWGVAMGLGLPFIFLTASPLKQFVPVKEVEKASVRRLVGYKQISKRLIFLKDSLDISQPLIISESYHMASELAFYFPEHPKTFVVNMGSRKNQFDLWEGLELETGKAKDAVFVSWNKSSPEEVLTFDSLIYEEKLLVKFKGDSIRSATIQFWHNLKAYNPMKTNAY